MLFRSMSITKRAKYEGLQEIDPAHSRIISCPACSTWDYALRGQYQGVLERLDSSRTFMRAQAECSRYTIVERNETAVTYTSTDEGQHASNSTLYLGNGYWWTGAITTYMYSDDAAPAEGSIPCSCAAIYVLHRSVYDTRYEPTHLYKCKNEILGYGGRFSESGTYAFTALVLAAAIAYRQNITQDEKLKPQDILKIKTYTPESAWALAFETTPPSPAVPDATAVASTIAQYSMLALAAMDQGVEPLVPGMDRPADLRTWEWGSQPYRTSKINVNWPFIIAIVCAVPLIQMVFLLAVVILANDIVVKDESQLCMARLLAPVVQKMGDHSSLLRVEEVVKALSDDGVTLKYGWEEQGGVMRVVIQKQADGVPPRTYRMFPEGIYG